MILKNAGRSSGNHQEAPGKSNRMVGWLWLSLINCWIAAVLVMFMIVRVLGSNTARHVLHSLRAR
jgi:hypothetical protein